MEYHPAENKCCILTFAEVHDAVRITVNGTVASIGDKIEPGVDTIIYKGKKIFVIPKVGYYHLINRPDCMTTKYAETMTEKEAEWWVDLAKKEYFFPQDRKKTYTDNEE